jgi:hypothetical protein
VSTQQALPFDEPVIPEHKCEEWICKHGCWYCGPCPCVENEE